VERYLPSDLVDIPAWVAKFSPPGRCDWCGKELTGKAKRFCRPGDGALDDISDCAIYYSNWWYSVHAFKRAVFIRDDFTCQHCGHRGVIPERPWLPAMGDLHCDHIIPLSKGGETETANLQTLCSRCNLRKGTRLEGAVRYAHGQLSLF